MTEATEQVDRQARAPQRPMWFRLIVGFPLFAFGAAIAVFMGVSAFLEMMTDDFFGMCVAAMVAFSGCLLARHGALLTLGINTRSAISVASSHHLVAYAPVMEHPRGMPPDPARCAATIHENWQCPKARGYGPEQAFCLKHWNDYSDHQGVA